LPSADRLLLLAFADVVVERRPFAARIRTKKQQWQGLDKRNTMCHPNPMHYQDLSLCHLVADARFGYQKGGNIRGEGYRIYIAETAAAICCRTIPRKKRETAGFATAFVRL